MLYKVFQPESNEMLQHLPVLNNIVSWRGIRVTGWCCPTINYLKI